MTHRVALTPPLAGRTAVKLYPGFGILGADIPATGDNGPSPVLNDDISADKEYHWRVETPPGSGTLTLFDDLTFTLEGAADGNWPWAYRLWENGADQGTATVYSQVGSPVGTFAATLADAVFSGGAAVAGASGSFSITTADVVFSGGAAVAGAAGSFSATLADIVFAGSAQVSPRASFNVAMTGCVFSGGAQSGAGSSDNETLPVAKYLAALDAPFGGLATHGHDYLRIAERFAARKSFPR